MFSKEIYLERRKQLKQKIQSGIVLLIGNKNTPFNCKENPYLFRQDSTFLYYTGLDKPDLAMIMDLDSGKDILFGNAPSPDHLIWSGPELDIIDLADRTGIEEVQKYSELKSYFQTVKGADASIHFLPAYQVEVCYELAGLLKMDVKELQNLKSEKLINSVVDQRSIKDEFEIKEMEYAIDIAHKMHTTAMIMAMPGAHERDIKGIIEGIASSMGGTLSYLPIVTIRGEILHNPNYRNTLENERFLLVDAGAESSKHYASDITRTIPVGQKFSRMQRGVYEVVLNANMAAIDGAKPGVSFKELHLDTAGVICQGLKDLGIMKGDPKEAVSEGAHALFFPHGLGHQIGLDVHDMEALGEDYVGYGDETERSQQFGLSFLRMAKKLVPGHTVTIEPGIYFIPHLISKWKSEKRFESFINYEQVELYEGMGGVRIEDEVLITEDGCRVLGKPIPKKVQDIEI